MSETVFLKARHKFSHGPSDWEFFEIYPSVYSQNLEDALEEWAREFAEKDGYNYSEHYRGCDYEVVPFPPCLWLRERIARLTSTCKEYQATIVKYQAMLESGQCGVLCEDKGDI